MLEYFAIIDNTNTVFAVCTINQNDYKTNKQKIAFLQLIYGKNCQFVQTYKDSEKRKNFAGIGYFYDENLDAFIPPKPYKSWVLNTEKYHYEAPKPLPDNENQYIWNEDKLNWTIYE